MGQHRADPIQTIVRRLWRAVCNGLRAFSAAAKHTPHIPGWNYQSKCQEIIDHGGRVEHRWYGPEGMEQAACFGETTDADRTFRRLISAHHCDACKEEKVKHELERAVQVRINRMQKEYAQDQLPNQKQIRYDMAWVIDLALNLSKKLEKVTRDA